MIGEREPPRARLGLERLLPLACVVGASTLFVSELMTTFTFVGGEQASGNELCSQLASNRHHFALGVLAIFAVVALLVAVLSASKPAALAVAIAGLLALLIFLIVDLPDANNVGTLQGCSPATSGSFFDAKAVPQAGFWLEMVGALALALSGVALATLTPAQLAALRPRRLDRGRRGSGSRRGDASAAAPLAGAESNPIADAGSDPPSDRPTRARRR